MTRDDVVSIVGDALRDQLDMDGIEYADPIGESTRLIGRGAPIDSLGLVSVIVTVEEKLHAQTGRTFTLADEKAMSQRNSPFLSVGTLADYALQLASDE